MSDKYRLGRWDAQRGLPSQAAAGRWSVGTFAYYDYTEGYSAEMAVQKWAAIRRGENRE